MPVSPQSVTDSKPKAPKLKIGMYFSWGTRLWYVADLGYDSEDRAIALLEDCYKETYSWTRVSLFKSSMREVKLEKC